MPKYKKFILFQFTQHDAVGGLDDVSGSYDTLAEAKDAVKTSPHDYNYVVDRDTWEIVADLV